MFAAKMVRPSGFEPLAFRLGGGRSILLSYGRIWNFWCHWRTNYAHLGGDRSILLSYRGIFTCMRLICGFGEAFLLPLRRRSLYPTELHGHVKLCKWNRTWNQPLVSPEWGALFIT